MSQNPEKTAVKYQDDRVVISEAPKEGENLNVFSRPGDKIDIGIDISRAAYKLVGGDIVLELPNGAFITFVNMGIMAFSGNAPILSLPGGMMIPATALLEKISEITQTPTDAVITNVPSQAASLDEVTQDQQNNAAQEQLEELQAQNQEAMEQLQQMMDIMQSQNSLSQSLIPDEGDNSLSVAEQLKEVENFKGPYTEAPPAYVPPDNPSSSNERSSSKPETSSPPLSKSAPQPSEPAPQPERVPDSLPGEEGGSDGEAEATLEFEIGFFQAKQEITKSSDASVATRVAGGGGSKLANQDTSPEAQIEPEIIDLSDSIRPSVIYADDPELFGESGEYVSRVVRITPQQPEGFGVTDIKISGLPEGFEILNGTADSNGVWTITPQQLKEIIDKYGNTQHEIAKEGFTVVKDENGQSIEFLVRYPAGTELGTHAITVEATTVFDTANLEEGQVVDAPAIKTITNSNTVNIEVKETVMADDYIYEAQNGEKGYVLNNNNNRNIIYTSQGDSTVYGGKGTDSVFGSYGDDTLYGGTGNDKLSGGTGVNTMDGGEGSDTVSYAFVERFTPKEVVDIMGLLSDEERNAIIADVKAGVTVDLEVGTAEGSSINRDYYKAVSENAPSGVSIDRLTPSFSDVFIGIENVEATDYNDTIYGDGVSNKLSGLSGDDTLYGRAGNDILDGGSGNDYLEGGSDTMVGESPDIVLSNLGAPSISLSALYGKMGDFIDGGAGVDSIDFSGALNTKGTSKGVTVALYTEDSDVSNEAGIAFGADTDIGVDVLMNIENVRGSGYDDFLIGDASNNTLSGIEGSDTMAGGKGDDTLYGYKAELSLLEIKTLVEQTLADDAELEGSIKAALTPLVDDRGDAGIFVQVDGSSVLVMQAGNYTFYEGVISGAVTIDTFDPATITDTDKVSSLKSDDTLKTDNNTAFFVDGDDYLSGGAGADKLYGGKGDDTLVGGAGNDEIDGGTGMDTIKFEGVSRVEVDLNSKNGAEYDASGKLVGVDSFNNIEIVYGSSGGDVLLGDGSDNVLYGDFGDDTLAGRDGDDTLVGGYGSDTVDYSSSGSGITADLAAGTATGEGNDTLSGIENLIGSNSNDNILGNDAANIIKGGLGNDTIKGGKGADTLYGGAHSDTLDYSGDPDKVVVDLSAGTATDGWGYADAIDGFENIIGSAGDDSFRGGSDNNTIQGGLGKDTVDYTGVNSNLTLDLSATEADGYVHAKVGSSETDYLKDIENITGGSGNDTLIGDDGANTIMGGAGNDTIDGGYGSDVIDGGDGTDTIDFSSIDNGTDYIAASASSGSISVTTHRDTDNDGTVDSTETDTISGIEIIKGSMGNDTIVGGGENNTFYGNDGDDILKGGGGNNILNGGSHSVGGGDWADYSNASAAVNVNLKSGAASNGDGGTDTLIGIEHIAGSQKAGDVLRGDDGDNIIDGSNDSLIDTLYGGAGNDTLFGGGADIASYQWSYGPIEVDLSKVLSTATWDGLTDAAKVTYLHSISGSEGSDILVGIDHVIGSGFDDNFLATSGSLVKTIDGGSGKDTIDYTNSLSAIAVTLGGTIDDVTLLNIENLKGSDLDLAGDTLAGDSGDNIIWGQKGDDTLKGTSGSDTLDGGDGTDWVDYSDTIITAPVSIDLGTGVVQKSGGIDRLVDVENARGTVYGDTLIGGTGVVNILEGAEGDDVLRGNMEGDTLRGGTDDEVSGDTADYSTSTGTLSMSLADNTVTDSIGTDTLQNIENLRAGSGADTLIGDVNANTLWGGTGNDTLDGGGSGATDFLYGEKGDDLFIGHGKGDTLDGGDDSDTIDYSGLGSYDSLEIDLAQNSGALTTGATTTTDIIKNMENVIGASGNDTITGSAGINTLDGGAGDDTLKGGMGNDTLIGGEHGGYGDTVSYHGSTFRITAGSLESGAITLSGGVETDALIGIENLIGTDNDDIITGNSDANTLSGMGGDDTFIRTTGNDVIDGGSGVDRVDYSSALDIMMIDLDQGEAGENGQAYTHTLKNIEIVIGSSNADTIIGDSGSNGLYGGAGDDMIKGTAGSNTLDGGEGSDTLFGGSGNDTFIGGDTGTNVDVVTYEDSESSIYATLHNGGKVTGDGTDVVLSGVEIFIGSRHNDTIEGSEGITTLYGGAGNDVMRDNQHYSSDIISSTLYGGEGSDTLRGGFDGDTLNGGTGSNWVDYQDYVSSDASTTIVAGDVTVDLVASTVSSGVFADNDVLISIQHARTGSGDDTFIGAQGESNTFDGGTGSDTISFAKVTGATGVEVDLGRASSDKVINDGGGVSDILFNIENIIGSDFNDTLSGDDGANIIDGGEGNDTLLGRGGDDTFTGGDGQDVLDYRTDNNYAVNIDLSTGTITGGDIGTDALTASHGIEEFIGSAYEDTFIGAASGSYTLWGGNSNDTFMTGAADETIYGEANNDYIAIQDFGGTDTIDGGTGTNTIDYSGMTGVYDHISVDFSANSVVVKDITDGDSDTDTVSNFYRLIATSGDDTLKGSDAKEERFDAGDGDDTVFVTGGGDVLNGGNNSALNTGGDWIDFSNATVGVSYTINHSYTNIGNLGALSTSGFEHIVGTAQGDALYGDGNLNTLIGGNGNDNLTGYGGDDILIGGVGNDTFEGGDHGGDNAGSDTIYGGTWDGTAHTDNGIDTVSYYNSGAITADLAANASYGAVGSGGDTDTLYGIENIYGSRQNDTIKGDVKDNNLRGDDGNDTLDGRGGDDRLEGGDGNDTFYAGAGNDNINGGAHDENGGDVLIFRDGDGVTAGITVDLAGGSASYTVGSTLYTDTISNIEHIISVTGDSNDTLIGNDSDNSIVAGKGNDILIGGAGDDTLLGGAGDDTLSGGAGYDSIDGGDGDNDWVDYSGATDGVDVSLRYTFQQYIGSSEGFDAISNIEHIIGSAQSDTLEGSNGNNTLIGGDGDDTLVGGLGNDYLDGDSGDDDWVSYNSLYFTTSGVDIDLDLVSNHVKAILDSGNVNYFQDTLSGIEHIEGSAQADRIKGDSSANSIRGGYGDDTVIHSGGSDTIDLGQEDDTFKITSIVGTGTDTVIGGSGEDTFDYSGLNANATIVLGGGVFSLGGYDFSLTGIENITAGSSSDTITQDSEDNMLDGGAGVDTIIYDTTDAINLSLRNQSASGDGNDVIKNFENVVMGSGNDTVEGDAGSNILDGGGGTNTLTYANAAGSITFDLANGSITGDGADTFNDFTNFVGSNYADTFKNASVDGLSLDGGLNIGGVDVADYGANTTSLSVNVDGSGTTTVADGSATDTLTRIEEIIGGAGDDTFTIADAANITKLDGGAGTGDAILLSGDDVNLSGVEVINFEVITLTGTQHLTLDATELDEETMTIDLRDTSSVTVKATYDPNDHDFDNVTITKSGTGSIAKLDVDYSLDLSAKSLTGLFNAFDIASGKTLTLDATQLDGESVDVDGGGNLVIEATAVSGDHDFERLTNSGGGTITLDVGYDVDISDKVLSAIDVFTVDNNRTLTLDAAQVEGRTISIQGAGDVVIEATHEVDGTSANYNFEYLSNDGSGNIILKIDIGSRDFSNKNLGGVNGYDVVDAGHTLTLNNDQLKDFMSLAGAGQVVVKTTGSSSDTDLSSLDIDSFSGGITVNDRTNNNIIKTTNNNDTVNISSGQDEVYTYDGDDIINSSQVLTANDTIDGGENNDTLNINAAGTINLTNVSNIETINLSDGASNTVTVGTNNGEIVGGTGNDEFKYAINELTSDDTVTGGAGSNTITFVDSGSVSSSDFVNASEVQTVNFHSGNDTLSIEDNDTHLVGIDINLGSGTNSVAFADINDLTSSYHITDGGGTDTISFSNSGSINSSDFANMSGVDIVSFSGGDDSVVIDDINLNSVRLQLNSGDDGITLNTASNLKNLIIDGGAHGAGDILNIADNGNITYVNTDFAGLSNIETLNLGDGIDTIILGETNIQNAGFTKLNTGAGDDVITIADTANLVEIDGDAGSGDTIKAGATIAVSAIDFKNIETFDINGQSVTFDSENLSEFTTIKDSGSGTMVAGEDLDLSSVGGTLDGSLHTLDINGKTITLNSSNLANFDNIKDSSGGGTLKIDGTTDLSSVSGKLADSLSTLDIAGNTVTINSDNLTTFETIRGSDAASDKLVLNDTTFDFSSESLSGVQVIDLNGTTKATDITFDDANLSDITSIVATTATAQTIMISETADISNITTTNTVGTLKLGSNANLTVNANNITQIASSNLTGSSGTETLTLAGDISLASTSMTLIENLALGGHTITLNDADLDDIDSISNGNITLAGSDTALDLTSQALTSITTVQLGTGGDTLTIDNGNAVEITNITGGSGSDTLTLDDTTNGVDITSITNTAVETITATDDTDVTIDSANLTNVTAITGGGNTETLTLSGNNSFDFSSIALTGFESIETSGAGNGNVYTVNATDLANVTTFEGQSSANQILKLTNATDLSDKTITDIEKLEFGNFEVSIDSGNMANFDEIHSTSSGTLNLKENADFDFSSTALTGVSTITTENAGTNTYTLDADDLNDVITFTGENGVTQALKLNDAADLSGKTISNIENLEFGNFTVSIDSGNLSSFDQINSTDSGTLNLKGDANFDFSSTDLTGANTITTTGATGGNIYTFDAADLTSITTFTGQNGAAQTLKLTGNTDLSDIDFTDIETLDLNGHIATINQDNLDSFTEITGGGLIISGDVGITSTTLTGITSIEVTASGDTLDINATQLDEETVSISGDGDVVITATGTAADHNFTGISRSGGSGDIILDVADNDLDITSLGADDLGAISKINIADTRAFEINGAQLNGNTVTIDTNTSGTLTVDAVDSADIDNITLEGSGDVVLNADSGATLDASTMTLTDYAGQITINGSTDDDVITGTSGGGVIDISNSGGTDELYGGAGNDVYKVTTSTLDSNDIIDDASGTDELIFENINSGNFDLNGQNISGIEKIILQQANDFNLTVDDTNYEIVGSNTGQDNITYNSADFSSADKLNGQDGTDTLRITGNNALDNTAFANVSNFEVLDLSGYSGTITIDSEVYDRFASIKLGSGTTTIDATMLDKVTSTDAGGTINISNLQDVLDIDLSSLSGTITASWQDDTAQFTGNLGSAAVTVASGTMQTSASKLDDTAVTGTGTVEISDLGTSGDLGDVKPSSLKITGQSGGSTFSGTLPATVAASAAIVVTAAAISVAASSLDEVHLNVQSGTTTIVSDADIASVADADDFSHIVAGGGAVTYEINHDIDIAGADSAILGDISTLDIAVGKIFTADSGQLDNIATLNSADDTAVLNVASSSSIDLSHIDDGDFAGTVTITGTTGVDSIVGTGFDDVIDAGDGNDAMVAGGDGDDTIYGGDGVDKIYGGVGNDTIYGGLHNDTIYGGEGDDFIIGEGSSDTIISDGLITDHDTIAGGYANFTDDSYNDTTIFDTLDYYTTWGNATTGYAFSVDLSSNQSQYYDTGSWHDKDEIYSIEKIIATDNDDTLIGNNANQTLIGNGGNDTLIDSGSATVINSGGSDVMDGGAGDDVFIFQSYSLTSDTTRPGTDPYIYNDTTPGDTVIGGSGNDTLRFATDSSDGELETADFTNVSGVERIELGNGGYTVNIDASSIAADSDSATLVGGEGDDIFQYELANFTAADNLIGGENGTGDDVDTLEITDVDANISGFDWSHVEGIERILFSGGGEHQVDAAMAAEFDTIVGGDEADTFVLDFSHLADLDVLDGGAESDTVELSGYDGATFDGSEFSNLETLDLVDGETITIDAEVVNGWISGSDFTIRSSDADSDTLSITNNGNYAYKQSGDTVWTTDGSDILTSVMVDGTGSTSYLIDTDSDGTEDFTLHVV